MLLAVLYCCPQKVFCQESGFKYLKYYYSYKDYDLQPQNWWVLQDKRGIIYVGNNVGLLEFDGTSWREIEIPNLMVRSMAMDDAGTLYIGGNNEIGCLVPNSTGTWQYISLLDQLEDDKKKFSNVWKTYVTRDGVYFQTFEFLLRLDTHSKEIKYWLPGPGGDFHFSFICRGKLFIRQFDKGLMLMKGDSPDLAPGGELFAKKKIYMMVPYDSQKILIGTQVNGFYIYDGIQAVPFPTEADDYLKEKKLYHGIQLSSGDFALATRQGGLVIIDSRGKLKEILDNTSGLEDNSVNYVFEDAQGNLWLALEKGVCKIEYTSPISTYDKRSHLYGMVMTVVGHKPGNLLYAGTSNGLFSLESKDKGKFRPVPGITYKCFSLVSINNSVLAATENGVYQVENNNYRRIIETPSFFLLRSQSDKNRVWAGTREGLVSLYLNAQNNQWRKERTFEEIRQDIRSLVEDKKRNLWVGTFKKGVLYVEFPIPGEISRYKATPYNSVQGLPGGEVYVYKANGQVIFASIKKGIFRFDEKTGRFISDPTLGPEYAGGENGKGVYRIAEDQHQHLWFQSARDGKNLQAIPGGNGTFKLNETPFLRIPKARINSIYPDPDGDIIWFASDDGLIRYHTKFEKNYHINFQSLIRQVQVNGKTVFNGCKNQTDHASSSKHPFIIAYKDRNISFKFAAPFFEGESGTGYQCLLEGYDDHWSEWSPETKKDYTNLDAGVYTFLVRAKNIFGNVGKEDHFIFKVLPPWFKTWWAFSIYVLALGLFMLMVVKWRSGKLEREKQRLEQVVKERTKEIREKSQQLEKHTVQLKEQSEKLKEVDKVKSRFFANISHEFRTPLTLITGPLEQMLFDCHDKKQQKQLTLMLRNSQRLLGLINQLLELSKFESGTVKLEARKQNMIPFLKGIVASFDPAATKNDLDLTFLSEAEDITLYFDPGKLEEVIFNLLANAIKFTPPGGRITVNAAPIAAREENFPGEALEISICDTGPGIPREQLTHIFDRFYQSDSTYEHHQKGSGIGLSIAKEMVELHHGKIDVHTREDRGTEFIIRLPMGDSHLKPEEIIEPLEKTYKPKSPGEIPAFYEMEKAEETTAGMTADYQEAGYPADQNDTDPLQPEKNIILVVEDSADVREYIREELEPFYEIVEAKDGKQGIEKARKIIPDLIISDVMMPGKDGYELSRELKSDIDTCHIPIILLTAKASEENIIKGLETGADDYVTKPFNTKILCIRIKNLIDLRSHLQQTFKREMSMQPAKISVSQNDRRFIKRLKEVIDKNISDPDFNVTQMCRDLDMSQPTLYRKIYALTGESPTEFIRSYRLKRGAELLKNNFGSILEVALEVGFSSANYFTKCFKKMFHQLPSSYLASEGE
jgi:signal transduction histidine kinase/CheY-like chemotaxis protein/ligand-binding sensor domain-containing protein